MKPIKSKVLFQGNRGRIRFSEAPWFSMVKDQPITVIGAGGIGSWLTHFLARAGAIVHLYDMDKYDINNMGGQLARWQALHTNKAEALATLVEDLLGEDTYVVAHPERFTDETTLTTPVVMLAVDDMNARRQIYDVWKANEQRKLLVDGRMGAEQFELYTATQEHDNYMGHWFPPHEAAQLPCAYKATSHIGSLVASMMMGVLTNYFSDNYVPESLTFNTQLFMLEGSQ